MTRGRAAADGPFALLVGIGAALALGLGFAVAGRPPALLDPIAACDRAAALLAARIESAGTLLPVAVLGAVLLSAGLALAHQLWATRRVLARVLAGAAPMTARLERLGREAGIEDRLDLVGDAAAYVFCYGLWSPRVCVSAGLADLLADDELAAVLRHEAHHLRHRDPLKILAGRSVASGLFFLPLAGALRNGYLAAKELCADADATAIGGELPLARALCKLLQADRPQWPAGVLAVGALSPTEARLQQLLDPQRIRPVLPSPMDWIVSLALVAGIFGFSWGSAMAGETAVVDSVCAPPGTGGGPVPAAALPLAEPATQAEAGSGAFLPAQGSRPAVEMRPELGSYFPALECDARCIDSDID